MISDTLNAVAGLISSFAWPLVVLILFLIFKRQIQTVIRNTSTFSFKAGSFEAALSTKKSVESALTAAAATKGSPDIPAAAERAQRVADNAVDTLVGRRGRQRRLGLWVDDEPRNNRFERAAFESLGIHFDIGRTTEDALELLEDNDYSIIISDMDRPPDKTAGLDLLDALRSRRCSAPCVIYAGSATPEQVAETKRRGGYGQVDDPSALIDMVVQALGPQ